MKASFLLEMIEDFDFFVIQAGLAIGHYLYLHVPWSKVAILGMVIPPFNRNPYNGYI